MIFIAFTIGLLQFASIFVLLLNPSLLVFSNKTNNPKCNLVKRETAGIYIILELELVWGI